jgi:hypothetical protein
MSETSEVIERDQKNGRFLPGNSGFGGRPRGSRNRLGEQFLEDLRTVWQEDGIEALRRCAREDATGFCKIISGLLPKTVDLNLDVTADAAAFASRFRDAVRLLHDQPQTRIKTIENAAGKPR